MLAMFAAALVLCLFAGLGVAADEKGTTHEGLIVSALDGKLTMTDKDGKNEHIHNVAADAKITCDGKDCKLTELKKGETVKVTTEKKGDKTMAVKIEAKKAP
jgi:hypothetical protein